MRENEPEALLKILIATGLAFVFIACGMKTKQVGDDESVEELKFKRYCDVKPDHCRPCPTGPGTCGGQPIAGACCCPGQGCVAVPNAEDCPNDTGCDFYVCEWGYQTTGSDGLPEVWCYD